MNSCCVVGLGYIGLPTAALFSMKGYSVLGVDINLDIVNSVNKGVSQLESHHYRMLLKRLLIKAALKPLQSLVIQISL